MLCGEDETDVGPDAGGVLGAEGAAMEEEEEPRDAMESEVDSTAE